MIPVFRDAPHFAANLRGLRKSSIKIIFETFGLSCRYSDDIPPIITPNSPWSYDDPGRLYNVLPSPFTKKVVPKYSSTPFRSSTPHPLSFLCSRNPFALSLSSPFCGHVALTKQSEAIRAAWMPAHISCEISISVVYVKCKVLCFRGGSIFHCIWGCFVGACFSAQVQVFSVSILSLCKNVCKNIRYIRNLCKIA